MKNLFILELKRFRIILLISMLILLTFSFFNSNIYQEATYQNEQLFIEIIMILVVSISTFMFVSDAFTDYQFLYAKRTIPNLKIFFTRFLVIVFNGLFIFIIGAFFINIKAFIFKINDPILFLISDIPNYAFILVGKLWIEWLTPITFMLNIFIYVFLILMIALRFRYFSCLYKDQSKFFNVLESVLVILLTHVLIRLTLYGLEQLIPILNLNNYNYTTILKNYYPIYMINPLFIPSLLIYPILIYSNVQQIKAYYVLLDYYDASYNMYPNSLTVQK
jgi:hypothetical protein